MTDHKPALNYKMSFDPLKGEKNRMEIHYTIPVVESDHQGNNITRQKPMKRYAQVLICESTKIDEILWTFEKFKQERQQSQMEWTNAATPYYMLFL